MTPSARVKSWCTRRWRVACRRCVSCLIVRIFYCMPSHILFLFLFFSVDERRRLLQRSTCTVVQLVTRVASRVSPQVQVHYLCLSGTCTRSLTPTAAEYLFDFFECCGTPPACCCCCVDRKRRRCTLPRLLAFVTSCRVRCFGEDGGPACAVSRAGLALALALAARGGLG